MCRLRLVVTMDYKTSDARRRIMSSISSKNTSPEVLLRKELHRRGLRYRIHVRKLPGNPDIVFTRKRVAIFVHGCFWHNHPGCAYWHMPRNNQEFWHQKFDKNRKRDQRNLANLKELGWHSLVIWECDIKHSPSAAADVVENFLRLHSTAPMV